MKKIFESRKGFTLIELLAVIVILGVIMVIAVPAITKYIDNSKKDSFVSTAQMYIDGVKKQVASGEISVSDGLSEKVFLSSIDVQKGGKSPYGGKLTISSYVLITSLGDDDYSYRIYLIDENKYCIPETNEKELKRESVKSKCVMEEPSSLISEITKNLLDNNTTYGNYTYMDGTYLKGVQENNYVWYNGFLWRIMGKNSDGTIKLITEEGVGSVAWGTANVVNWNAPGYIKDWLNNYFYSNLDSNKTNIIENSNWCINITTESTSARTDCTGGTLVESKVGLISIDEYNLSGASFTNNTYGLVNSKIFWTLTPMSASNAWMVMFTSGTTNGAVTNTYGARPIINVSASATVTGGNGTLGDSYILNQSISNKTGKLKDNASSGEYVKLSNKTYRVVSKDANGVKIIYDGYYEETTGTPTMIAYGTDNTFAASTGIGLKLNGDVLNWLGNSSKIVSSNWYQTAGFGSGTTYTTILNDTSNPINAKVGLIRVGEMMSGQSASILTKNYTVRSNRANGKNYWTMNKYMSASNAWIVCNYGYVNFSDVTDAYAIRPVIVVGNDTMITTGNGTLQSPYKID